jgi:regulator of replication initiation timing
MSVKQYAEQLSDILMQIEDLKVQAKSIVEDAKESGVPTKALNRVAREMIMDSTKLAKRLEDERQIDLFRDEVDLMRRKGLVPNMRLAAE